MFLVGTDAASTYPLLDTLTPEGYAYGMVSGYSAGYCLTCMHQSDGWKGNTHLENAIGVSGIVDHNGAVEAGEDKITGRGWISSKHAVSQDGASANTYCAYCHAPDQVGVTNDPELGKALKKGKHAMNCAGCHPSNSYAGRNGTRFANFKPGSNPATDSNWKPAKVSDGKAANGQCLFCHGSYHGFAVDLHENMVKSGSLRCIDCHMAVYNNLASGLEERYHNMKVLENGSDSCAECHSFKKKEMAEKVATLLGNHNTKKHTLPTF
jgi:formate-dependent nitrite reductase cytochrome c552 subunit